MIFSPCLSLRRTVSELEQMSNFEFTEEDFADDGDDDSIRDGPGPGMEELDLGFEGGSGVVDLGL